MVTTTKVRTKSGTFLDPRRRPLRSFTALFALNRRPASPPCSKRHREPEPTTAIRQKPRAAESRATTSSPPRGSKCSRAHGLGRSGDCWCGFEHYPKKGEITITSGYRPGPGSYHGGAVVSRQPGRRDRHRRRWAQPRRIAQDARRREMALWPFSLPIQSRWGRRLGSTGCPRLKLLSKNRRRGGTDCPASLSSACRGEAFYAAPVT